MLESQPANTITELKAKALAAVSKAAKDCNAKDNTIERERSKCASLKLLNGNLERELQRERDMVAQTQQVCKDMVDMVAAAKAVKVCKDDILLELQSVRKVVGDGLEDLKTFLVAKLDENSESMRKSVVDRLEEREVEFAGGKAFEELMEIKLGALELVERKDFLRSSK